MYFFFFNYSRDRNIRTKNLSIIESLLYWLLLLLISILRYQSIYFIVNVICNPLTCNTQIDRTRKVSFSFNFNLCTFIYILYKNVKLLSHQIMFTFFIWQKKIDTSNQSFINYTL